MGSMPRRAQASSQKENPATTSSPTDSSARSSSTVRSATDGEPDGVDDPPVFDGGGTHHLHDRAVDIVEGRSVVVAVIQA